MTGQGKEDPNYTIIIVGEDGLYRLTKDKWLNEKNLLNDPAGQGVINQLTEFGAYLSFVPPALAVGIGEVCTVVNLRAILKNNVDPASHKTTGAPTSPKTSAEHTPRKS